MVNINWTKEAENWLKDIYDYISKTKNDRNNIKNLKSVAKKHIKSNKRQ